MATIDKLQRLIQTKKEIKEAINSRGGSISSLDTFASYPLQILTLSTGTSGVDFSGLGYNYAPQYIVDAIEHSKEYRRDFITKNSSNPTTTTIFYDPELLYFPKVEIDENKELRFEPLPSNPGELSLTPNFCNVLSSLTIFPDLDFKGKEIKNASDSLFSGGTSLQSVHLNNLYVRSFENMFSGCSSLKDVDLSKIKYDKSVTSLSGMFNGCSNLLEFKFPEDFEFPSVTNISSMFYNCKNIKNIDLSTCNFNLSSIGAAFYNCKNLEYLNLENINTENVTSLGYFLENCKSLKEIKGLKELNTKNVTTLQGAFENIILDEVDLSGWDVTNVKYMNDLFRDSLIRTVNLTGWNPLNVITLKLFFYTTNTATLEQIMGLGNWNISNVTDISWAFYHQEKLQDLDLSNWDFSSVTNASQFMSYCKNLTNVYGPIRGIKIDLSLNTLENLTAESAMVFINGLEEVDSPKTISFHSKVKNQLTEDQIAIATAKGWTVA